jgi:probable HAF family extracellular repeat protein
MNHQKQLYRIWSRFLCPSPKKESEMRMFVTTKRIGISLALFFLSLNVAPLHATEYNVTLLPTLGGSYGGAYGINDLGQVVGWVTKSNDDYCYPCVWTNGVVTNLAALGGSGYAKSINNAGQVVGTCRGHAFYWQDSTGMIDLGTLGGNTTYFDESEAFSINDAGQVVGWAYMQDSCHAFLWQKGLGMTDLGAAGHANSINDKGQIVGGAYQEDYIVASWPDMNISQGTEAYLINNENQVVIRDDQSMCFLWENGITTALGLLPDTEYCVATGINDVGQIVGYCSGFKCPLVPFLWTPNEGMIDLNTLIDSSGITIDQATGINNQGQIICNSNQGALLLTPVPEPATYSFFILVGLTFLRCRKSQ